MYMCNSFEFCTRGGHLWFSNISCLFFDGLVDTQVWALLSRSHCRVFDTLVNFEAHGPLVYYGRQLTYLYFLYNWCLIRESLSLSLSLSLRNCHEKSNYYLNVCVQDLNRCMESMLWKNAEKAYCNIQVGLAN